MKVTLRMLLDMDACLNALGNFERIFGDEVEVTPESCLIAVQEGLDVVWFMKSINRLRARRYLHQINRALIACDDIIDKHHRRWAVGDIDATTYYMASTKAHETYQEAKAQFLYEALQ
jgi:hypothetical protein